MLSFYTSRNQNVLRFVCVLVLGCTALLGSNARANVVYRTAWVGNTLSGANAKWVQLSASGMSVAADGSVYLNTFWDEGGHAASVYKNGDLVGGFDHTHGWGYMGGDAIAANDKYVYVAQQASNEGGGLVAEDTWPHKGFIWEGISRRMRATRGPAPFAGGKGGHGDTLKGTFLVINAVPEKTDAAIRSIVATNDLVYAADPANDSIHVFDAETMAPVATWNAPGAVGLALAPSGNLWVLEHSGAGVPGTGPASSTIVELDSKGNRLGPVITAVPNATAIACDNTGRLLVADNGLDQQVKVFGNLDTSPTQVDTLGAKGGIYAGVRGLAGPARFNGLMGVGCDSTGNLYVCSTNNGTSLECYSPDHKLLWNLEGLTFVDCGDFDPATDGRDIYTRASHFTVDLSAGAIPAAVRVGGPLSAINNWRYAGYTIDRLRYPDDPRLHQAVTTAFVRRLGARRYLYMTDMVSSALSVYRLDDADQIAVPCAYFAQGHINGDWPPNQPAKGRWIWRDSNGNGSFDAGEFDGDGVNDPSTWAWSVDSHGDVWQGYQDTGKIVRFHFKGIDANGVPMYSRAASDTMATPAPFAGPAPGVQLERVEYFPDVDVMYLSGFSDDDPNTHGDWKGTGPVICRYDHWSGRRTLRWKIQIPADPAQERSKTYGMPSSMCFAGRYMFVSYLITAEQRIYDISDGHYVGTIRPGPEVGKASGWIDLPYGNSAIRRSNGEYLLLSEEDAFAKMILYHWTPAVRAPAAPELRIAPAPKMPDNSIVTTLEWSDVPNGYTYTIKSANAPTGPFVTVADGLELPQYSLSAPIPAGTIQYFQVIAVNTAGVSAPSNTIRVGAALAQSPPAAASP